MKVFLLLLIAASIGISIAASDVTLDALKRCSSVFSRRFCTFEFDRAAVETAVKCNSNTYAEYFSRICSRDSQNGAYCLKAEVYVQDMIRVSKVCAQSIADNSANCSSECKSHLQTIHNDLGCCINAIYNNTDVRPFLRPVLNYSLWSSCGVEPVITACIGELSYTLPVTPLSTCSFHELQSRLNEVLCSPSVIDNIETIFTGNIDCEDFLQFILESCSLDASEDFCI